MGVYGLTKYYCTHSRARKKVSLKHLAQKTFSQTGKKAKLLCDYFAIMFPMLSQVDRMLSFLHHTSSFYCDTNFEIYARKITSFVKAFQHLGIDLVFFVDGPHGVYELQFKAKFSTLKDRYMHQLKAQHDSQQTYSMIKESIRLKPSPALLPMQWLMTLESAGVEIIYCLGEADQELAHYARSHPEACGILSTDSDFVVMEGSTLFPYDLLKFTPALIHGVHIDKPEDITCETVSPSTLERALGIKEEQLPDLAILCGNDFTKPFNRQLRRKLMKDLMLEATNVETVAKWLQGKEVPLINYRPFNIFCTNHPEYKNAVVYTYNFYSKDYSSLGVVSSKQSYNIFQAILLGISKCGIWWDEFIPESLTLGSPCVQELLLPLRRIIYFFLGMKSVREFGSTQVEYFAETSVILPKHDESADLRSLHSSNFRDLNANEKLLSFLYLTVNALTFGNHLEEIGNVPTQVASECSSLDLRECLPSKDIFVCGCLRLIAYLNQHSTPRLNLSHAELDALLITCLSCCIELKLPHDCAYLIPSIRSDTIESWLFRILTHAYLLATVLGLSDRLPQPKNVFSPMVFLLLHRIATQNSNCAKSKELIAMRTVWKKFMSFSSVTALSSAMFTHEAIKSPTLRGDLEILYLFANALTEVASHRDVLSPRHPKPKKVKSPSARSRVTSNQKPSVPHRRRQSVFQHEHEWVTWFEQPDEEDSEEEYGEEEEYDLSYNKLCAGKITCKTCNKHFKEEQHYHDHHRKCYLCDFSACIKVLRKHEFKHAYCSVDEPLFGSSTPSKSVRCESYTAELQSVNKQILRNSGHLKSYRKPKSRSLIACTVVRIHQRHCRISHSRNNAADNITGGKQSCEPCSRRGFKSQRSYQAHLTSHIKCDICGLEACPKVLTEHKLTHTEALEPDAAGSSRLSHSTFYEPLALAFPRPFQLHVQPQETAYHGEINTAGKDTISSADPALVLADTNIYTCSEGEAIVTVTDVTHEREDSQSDTEGGSTSDLRAQSSSQKVQQPSHKYNPGSEMHMVEYFKDYIEENGGEASITSLRRIAFQNYKKKYNGSPFLNKNLFRFHPQDFIVVEGAGICRIKLKKHATAIENYKELVISTTKSSPSTCYPDTSDDHNDLAPAQGSMPSFQRDSIVCSLKSDGMHRSLDVADKVLTEHKLTHTIPLYPDEAVPNTLSHPPFHEPLAVAIVSESSPFQLHVQPQEAVYHEYTAGKDTISSADPALADTNIYTCSEGEAIVTVTDVNVTHEREDSQSDTKGGSTLDLQAQSSSQKVQKPSHKYNPGSEMHMVEYFKDYLEENGGEASITSLRRIAFQNYKKKYNGFPFLSKNLFKSHPQHFIVADGTGFCRIELEKHATAVENCVIPTTESSPSTCCPDTSDDHNDLAPAQGSMPSFQRDSSPIFLESDGLHRSLDMADKERSVPKAATMLHGDPDLVSGHHPDPMKMDNRMFPKVDSPSITADKPRLPWSESKHIQYEDIPGHEIPEHDWLLTNPPLSTVCTHPGGNCAVAVQNGMSNKQPALAMRSNKKEGSQDNMYAGDYSTPNYQSSSQKVQQPVHDHKATPGSDLHLVMYLIDYLKNNDGEASITSLRRIPFRSYQEKYGGLLYLGKALFKSYPQDFQVVEGAGFCRIKLLQHPKIVNEGEVGGLPPSSNPPDIPNSPVSSIPGAGDEDSDMANYEISIRGVSAPFEKGKFQDASSARVTTPANVLKMHLSIASLEGLTGAVTSEMMATEHPPVEVHKKDSTTVSIVKAFVPTKEVQLQPSEHEVSIKHAQNEQHTSLQSVATAESSCKSTDLTENGTCTTSEAKGTSDGANVFFVSGVKFMGGNEDTQKDVSVDSKGSGPQQLVLSGNTVQFALVSCQPPVPGSKLHLAEFLRDFLEQNGGEACLNVLRKCAFKRYQQKYHQYLFLSKKFLRSYPEYFDILDGTYPCIVKLHKPIPPAADASTLKLHAKPKPESLPATVGKEREQEITYSEQDHVARDEDNCAGPSHTSCLSQLKSMGQDTCTIHIVNPDQSMSNTQQETVCLDASLESQTPGSSEHIVKYFKEYLSGHGGGDGCHVNELMEVFDLKYKQEYALPRQPPTAKVHKEFFGTHSDVFRVSRHGIVRLREKNPVSQQTEYGMPQLPPFRANIASQPLNPQSDLPNRSLPKADDSLWPLQSKSVPKSALPKVEDVTSPLKSKTNLPKRGLPKAIWPPKSKNSLPNSISPKANEVSKTLSDLPRFGDEAPMCRSSPNANSMSLTNSVPPMVNQPPNSKRALSKADDASQPHVKKTNSDLSRLKHALQPQQYKTAHDVQHSALSRVTPSHSKGEPFTPQHVAEYFGNHLSKYGECSVEELKKTFERKYKKQYIMPYYAVITFVSENFFRRRSDLFEVTTNGIVKLKKSARS